MIESIIRHIVREELEDVFDDSLSCHLAPIKLQLRKILMVEQDLADALVTQSQTIRDAVAAAAQRILDAITAAVAASDVSPKLQAALDQGQADIDAINALAPATTPAP